MNSSQPGSRTTSFNRQRRPSVSSLGLSLNLSRTTSRDIAVAESIAVQEPPETKSLLGDEDDDDSEQVVYPKKVRYLIMLCAFLTSTGFGVTQVPLLYVFRLMTCDEYYKTHASPTAVTTPTADTTNVNLLRAISMLFWDPMVRLTGTVSITSSSRCSVPAIESSSALNIALLGASTTVFGIMNLFIAGLLIKRIGLKRTLVINVGFPAVRVLIQNVGVEVWGYTGIVIVQLSQITTVLGGPSGYLLVLNSFITEVVENESRTAALGRVSGSTMFGSAFGYLIGGLVAEAFGINMPFRVAFVIFLVSACYVAICLPYMPPESGRKMAMLSSEKPNRNVFVRFFAPLLIFTPKKFIQRNGKVQREYGIFLLACGVFLGILATGYLATLLQLYATDAFNFGTSANGWLIFMYSLLRGLSLTFTFPFFIKIGRAWMAKKQAKKNNAAGNAPTGSSEQDPLLPSSGAQQQPDLEQILRFDLLYTRFSLLADGLLTLLCTFTREGWQLYVVAAFLPLSAGTGSAAKGTVLSMVGSTASSDERTDALAGLSLVENMARLATTFVFGVIFAAFAAIGRADLVFTCNAGVAVFGFILLYFARFPPTGSRRLDRVQQANGETHE